MHCPEKTRKITPGQKKHTWKMKGWKMKEWKMHDMKKVENAHTGK